MLSPVRGAVLAAALLPGLLLGLSTTPSSAAPAVERPPAAERKAPRPQVYEVSPASGSVRGGTVVVLRGKYFSRTTKVVFGKTPARRVTVVSDRKLRVVSPPHRAGLFRIRVTTKSGRSEPGAFDAFRYLDTGGGGTPPPPPPPPPPPVGPVVTALTPDEGSGCGGTSVTITGTGLGGATEVRFGSTPASFTVVGPSQISVTTPSHNLVLGGVLGSSGGQVDVTVTTPVASSPDGTADDYTYLSASSCL